MQKRGFFKFSSKRGTLITRQMIIHIGMISILVLVYFILKGYVDSIRNDAQFEMTFLVRDLALLTNTLYSAPGNVEYKYSIEAKYFDNFNFEFSELSSVDDKQVVKVFGYEHKKIYPYGKTSEDKEKYVINKVQSIKFSKEGNKLSIKNE